MTNPTSTAWTRFHHRIPEHVVPGMRLGRNLVIDSRDAFYPYRGDPARTLVSTLFDRHIGILNQGNVGSCTGNAETGMLATGVFWDAIAKWLGTTVTLDEAEALKIYSAGETIDGDGPYPPNDNGSSGPSVAKAARNLGLINGWQHATTVDAMASALQDRATIIGINWYDSFDQPDRSTGLIKISPNAGVRGGHEVVLRGVDPSAQTFRGDNSWGPGWGDAGSFTLGWGDMERLLAEGGDCTVQTPVGNPLPVPVPVVDADTALWTVAGPWTAEHRSRPDLVQLQAALLTWRQAKAGVIR